MTTSKDHDLNAGRVPDDLNGLRVLVVEDSWDVATALTRLLKAWGVEVLGPAATTADALVLICQGAVDAASAYVTQRKQFGQPIGEFQGVQFMLADMAMRTEAARQLIYSAAAKAERGEPDLTWASAAAKVFASDTAMAVTTDAVQLFGGYGYTRDFTVERMMRDAKITQIYAGTNQVQRIVMARQPLRG